jgi:hypothetical protein
MEQRKEMPPVKGKAGGKPVNPIARELRGA